MLVQFGVKDIGSVYGNNKGDSYIYFPIEFYNFPTVIANVGGGAYTPHTEISGPTIMHTHKDGFETRVYNNYSQSLTVSILWIAMGRWKA